MARLTRIIILLAVTLPVQPRIIFAGLSVMKIRILCSLILLVAAALSLCCAPAPAPYNKIVADYYNRTLDTLVYELHDFYAAAKAKRPVAQLKAHFLDCRATYKKISFFIEQFDTRGARLLNGPDLLRIEDDTQTDSTKLHGFQHIESNLYAARPDMRDLVTEIGTR